MESFRDMSDHLGELVFPGFLLELPAPVMDHLPRYLDGLGHRLDKQARDPSRDVASTRIVRPWWEAWRERRDRHAREGIVDPALEEFRTLLEEFRISLFAQHLGTARPASEKRLRQHWKTVR